jgi:hypothetical protein
MAVSSSTPSVLTRDWEKGQPVIEYPPSQASGVLWGNRVRSSTFGTDSDTDPNPLNCPSRTGSSLTGQLSSPLASRAASNKPDDNPPSRSLYGSYMPDVEGVELFEPPSEDNSEREKNAPFKYKVCPAATAACS